MLNLLRVEEVLCLVVLQLILGIEGLDEVVVVHVVGDLRDFGGLDEV